MALPMRDLVQSLSTKKAKEACQRILRELKISGTLMALYPDGSVETGLEQSFVGRILGRKEKSFIYVTKDGALGFLPQPDLLAEHGIKKTKSLALTAILETYAVHMNNAFHATGFDTAFEWQDLCGRGTRWGPEISAFPDLREIISVQAIWFEEQRRTVRKELYGMDAPYYMISGGELRQDLSLSESLASQTYEDYAAGCTPFQIPLADILDKANETMLCRVLSGKDSLLVNILDYPKDSVIYKAAYRALSYCNAAWALRFDKEWKDNNLTPSINNAADLALLGPVTSIKRPVMTRPPKQKNTFDSIRLQISLVSRNAMPDRNAFIKANRRAYARLGWHIMKDKYKGAIPLNMFSMEHMTITADDTLEYVFMIKKGIEEQIEAADSGKEE